MSFFIQQGGWKFLANIIANGDRRIDGMYAEYSVDPLVAGERSHDKYSLSSDSGYLRIPLTNIFVDDTATIHFNAYLQADDIPATASSKASVYCATLVSMDRNNRSNDVLVFTVDLKKPVPLIHDSYIVLHAGLKLGDVK